MKKTIYRKLVFAFLGVAAGIMLCGGIVLWGIAEMTRTVQAVEESGRVGLDPNAPPEVALALMRTQARAAHERVVDLRHRLERVAIVGAGLALVLAALWSYLLARGFVQRLRDLQTHVQEVSRRGHGDPMVSDQDDEIGAVVAAFNEMLPSLARSREKLAQAERTAAINETAVAVRHEVNNFLQGVLGALELILEAPVRRRTANFKEILHVIRGQCERLQGLTERLAQAGSAKSATYVGNVSMIELSATTAGSKLP